MFVSNTIIKSQKQINKFLGQEIIHPKKNFLKSQKTFSQIKSLEKSHFFQLFILKRHEFKDLIHSMLYTYSYIKSNFEKLAKIDLLTDELSLVFDDL